MNNFHFVFSITSIINYGKLDKNVREKKGENRIFRFSTKEWTASFISYENVKCHKAGDKEIYTSIILPYRCNNVGYVAVNDETNILSPR